jgi:hypothetical protein
VKKLASLASEHRSVKRPVVPCNLLLQIELALHGGRATNPFSHGYHQAWPFFYVQKSATPGRKCSFGFRGPGTNYFYCPLTSPAPHFCCYDARVINRGPGMDALPSGPFFVRSRPWCSGIHTLPCCSGTVMARFDVLKEGRTLGDFVRRTPHTMRRRPC